MAQPKQRKRRRKHRGTQAGTIERSGRTGQSRNREDAKAISRQRRQQRLDRPPTWRSSAQRAAIAAALFGLIVIVLFHRSPVQGLALAAFMVVFYIPLGYLTDLTIYRFRMRRKQAAAKK
jgi:hypothetical protein